MRVCRGYHSNGTGSHRFRWGRSRDSFGKNQSSVREFEWGRRGYEGGGDGDKVWERGERGFKGFFFLLSSFNCWFTLINLEIVFCKEAILESQICLEASRYQLKRVSHLFCFILQLQSSNLVLREASLRRSKIPIMAVGVLNCFWLSWSN